MARTGNPEKYSGWFFTARVFCAGAMLFVSFAAAAPAAPAAGKDTAAIKHHRLQIDPVSLLVGGLYGYYEYRINFHHALAINGGYTYPLLGTEAWLAGANYRYYYNRRTFVGLVVNNGFQSFKLPSTERGDTTKYPLEISFLNVGANWGRVYYLMKRFPLTLRFGAGYPVKSELTWKNGLRHPEADTYESLYRFISCLDSELSIGVSF
jgi:hypothetical protein